MKVEGGRSRVEVAPDGVGVVRPRAIAAAEAEVVLPKDELLITKSVSIPPRERCLGSLGGGNHT